MSANGCGRCPCPRTTRFGRSWAWSKAGRRTRRVWTTWSTDRTAVGDLRRYVVLDRSCDGGRHAPRRGPSTLAYRRCAARDDQPRSGRDVDLPEPPPRSRPGRRIPREDVAGSPPADRVREQGARGGGVALASRARRTRILVRRCDELCCHALVADSRGVGV